MVSATTVTVTVSVPTAMSVSDKVITKKYSFDQADKLSGAPKFKMVIPITISEHGTLEITVESMNQERPMGIDFAW